jgi:hypothetical protein
MNNFRTSYELAIAGKRIAAWTEDNRNLPPPKRFVRIPHNILARPELADYSIRAKVVNWDQVNGRYLVTLEAITLNLG